MTAGARLRRDVGGTVAGADLARLHEDGAGASSAATSRSPRTPFVAQPFFGEYATHAARPATASDPLGQHRTRRTAGRRSPTRNGQGTTGQAAARSTRPTPYESPPQHGAEHRSGRRRRPPRGHRPPADRQRRGRRRLHPADPAAGTVPRGMAKEEKVEFEGEVVEALPNAMFRVQARQRPRRARPRGGQDAPLPDPHPARRPRARRAVALRPRPRAHRLPPPVARERRA